MQHENPDTAREVVAGVIGVGTPTPHGYEHQLKDGGTSDVPISQLETIAKRFAPLVWIDPNEQFRPCTLTDYLRNVNLYYDPTGRKVVEEYLLIKERPSESDLHDGGLFALLEAHRARTRDKRLEHLTLDNMVRRAWKMAVRDQEGQQGVSWDDLNTVPFLSRVRRYHDHWVRHGGHLRLEEGAAELACSFVSFLRGVRLVSVRRSSTC